MQPSIVAEAAEAVFVFDLDDTLYLERDFARSGFAAVGQFLREALGVEGFAAHCGRLLSSGARGTIFNQALSDLGWSCDSVLVDRMVEIYRDHVPTIALAPDAEACLSQLRGRLALITDGPEKTQRAKIAALGLGEHIDLMVVTGAWPGEFGKPHPRAFKEVMTWSGQPAEAHIYVADNAAKDFIAPRALGWRTVQILRPGRIHHAAPPSPEHAADTVIETLDDFPRCLASAYPARSNQGF
ncbi:MAG: HAD family hydrolase [Novosphingobium sp.]